MKEKSRCRDWCSRRSGTAARCSLTAAGATQYGSDGRGAGMRLIDEIRRQPSNSARRGNRPLRSRQMLGICQTRSCPRAPTSTRTTVCECRLDFETPSPSGVGSVAASHQPEHAHGAGRASQRECQTALHVSREAAELSQSIHQQAERGHCRHAAGCKAAEKCQGLK